MTKQAHISSGLRFVLTISPMFDTIAIEISSVSKVYIHVF